MYLLPRTYLKITKICPKIQVQGGDFGRFAHCAHTIIDDFSLPLIFGPKLPVIYTTKKMPLKGVVFGHFCPLCTKIIEKFQKYLLRFFVT